MRNSVLIRLFFAQSQFEGTFKVELEYMHYVKSHLKLAGLAFPKLKRASTQVFFDGERKHVRNPWIVIVVWAFRGRRVKPCSIRTSSVRTGCKERYVLALAGSIDSSLFSGRVLVGSWKRWRYASYSEKGSSDRSVLCTRNFEADPRPEKTPSPCAVSIAAQKDCTIFYSMTPSTVQWMAWHTFNNFPCIM